VEFEKPRDEIPKASGKLRLFERGLSFGVSPARSGLEVSPEGLTVDLTLREGERMLGMGN
jgi:hypothetical protein